MLVGRVGDFGGLRYGGGGSECGVGDVNSSDDVDGDGLSMSMVMMLHKMADISENYLIFP